MRLAVDRPCHRLSAFVSFLLSMFRESPRVGGVLADVPRRLRGDLGRDL
jgi:hypothetical protein